LIPPFASPVHGTLNTFRLSFYPVAAFPHGEMAGMEGDAKVLERQRWTGIKIVAVAKAKSLPCNNLTCRV
jgi:hypothetical protein